MIFHLLQLYSLLFLNRVFSSTFVSKARLLHHVGQSDSSQEERVGYSLDFMIKLSRLLLAYPGNWIGHEYLTWGRGEWVGKGGRSLGCKMALHAK